MDEFFTAVWKNKPFTITLPSDKVKLVVRKEVLQFCERHDMFALDFLQSNYKTERGGIIFNTTEDFNPQLQVSVFMGALNDAIPSGFLVLVLCPDELLVKWHYYMTWCGLFNVQVISNEGDLTNICPESNTVLLLGFSNLKLVQCLLEQGNMFQSVIIDKLDEVATKLVTRKLQGKFNIGITYRNFYTNPDQKLQWSMLNWSNPGQVGKLSDFYEIDNDNFANFRDNYKDFWVRLTWNFCESFRAPSLETKGKLRGILREWAKEHNLSCHLLTVPKPTLKRKRKKVEFIASDSSSEESEKEVNKPSPSKSKKCVTTGENSKIIEPKIDEQFQDISLKTDDSTEQKDVIEVEANKIEDILSDNGSLSSTEEDLMCLIGIKPKKISKKSPIKHNNSIIDDLLESSVPSVKTGLSQVELHKSEQIILSAEDDFFKGLHGGNSLLVPTQVNNNYDNVCSPVADFDVDSLVSEVMEIANK